MKEIMTADWLSFFTTLTQVSLALASLLFVGFTIYFTNRKQKLVKLEIGVGTAYYVEVITAFVLSAIVILPPHDWYFGGGVVVALLNIVFYLWIDQHFLGEYRNAHRIAYPKKKWWEIKKWWREIFTKKWWRDVFMKRPPTGNPLADVYEPYKLPCDDRIIFGARTILLLVFSCLGVAVQLGIVSHVNLAGLALEVFGILTALYLASCVIGVWLFFFVYTQGDEVPSVPVTAKTRATQKRGPRAKAAQQAKEEELPLHPPTN